MSIDLQFNTYQQLYFQHQTIRREHQIILLQSLQQLKTNVNNSLKDDKYKYENIKETYYHKFNIFKRIFTHTALQYRNSFVIPFEQIYQQRKYLSTKIIQLFNEITFETLSIEMRTHWNGSIAVVYNPITGRTEWKQYRHGGIHGVFNPITHTIEWEDGFQTGVYGVFNPKLNIVEWKKFYKGSVHGVYNPSIDTIEWQTSFHSGIGGVYNPLTKEIEWKTSFKGGIVGYFDYETQTIKWIEKWHHGLALISWNSSMNSYLTTASCGWYGDN
ncbi:unnamed protein product [Rotaria sordida]|uniref:Uncharacterized protein n=1 Tax=Rotaria sordida TaxID=392033 RepID=A0A814XYJ8_9BILA|nr:unnamed protein product [Rotaria sordida]